MYFLRFNIKLTNPLKAKIHSGVSTYIFVYNGIFIWHFKFILMKQIYEKIKCRCKLLKTSRYKEVLKCLSSNNRPLIYLLVLWFYQCPNSELLLPDASVKLQHSVKFASSSLTLFHVSCDSRSFWQPPISKVLIQLFFV